MSDPESRSLPSASKAHRLRRCPGSENLIRELRAKRSLKTPEPSPDAQSGIRVHAAWAGEAVELSHSETMTLENIRRIESMLVADWAGNESYKLFGREERLWLHEGIEPVMSGQYDTAYRSEDSKRVLILDAKTLYGEVEPAEHNDQLRALVALFHHNYPALESFRVAIISPNSGDRCSVADYDRLEAQLALRLLFLTLAESQDPYAPRVPGPYCSHCPAQLNCEEVRQLVGTTYNLAKRIEQGEFQLPLGERGSRILDNIKLAKKTLAALEEAYKHELLVAPESIPGWRLKPGKRIRQITDVNSALETAINNGISMADFLFCTDLVIKRLQDQLGVASRTTGKLLENRFNQVFEHLITIKEYAPELEHTRQKRLQNV